MRNVTRRASWHSRFHLGWAILAVVASSIAAARSGEAAVQPHRALYSMSLESAKSSSGLIGASGTLSYKWGDTCDGWIIEQNYKLSMQYQDEQPVSIQSNYVTWESKDGRKYRFNQREMRNNAIVDDLRGDASLKGSGGTARFRSPRSKDFTLPAGSMFPTAHTLSLIKAGQAQRRFLSARVFDGSTFDGTSTVSAVIAPMEKSNVALSSLGIATPLLNRPSWQIWLSFFSDSSKDQQPDYSLSMRLLDNGVSSEMTIDYGDYVLKAQLLTIEAIPKPVC